MNGGQQDTPKSPKCCIRKFDKEIFHNTNQGNAFVDVWRTVLRYAWWMIQTRKSTLMSNESEDLLSRKSWIFSNNLLFTETHKKRMAALKKINVHFQPNPYTYKMSQMRHYCNYEECHVNKDITFTKVVFLSIWTEHTFEGPWTLNPGRNNFSKINSLQHQSL